MVRRACAALVCALTPVTLVAVQFYVVEWPLRALVVVVGAGLCCPLCAPSFSNLPALSCAAPDRASDADLQEEERANKLALAAAKRSVEEFKVSSETAERAKVEIDIQYRHLTEVNKDQQTENRELQVRLGPRFRAAVAVSSGLCGIRSCRCSCV